ncbi:MAG: hypothetical protein DMG71_20605 [Acidobacteria bacterium]|nr:MAG: hypothetical protein DMG71_20605 [Acidobacteriota bacterium]
MKKYIIGAVLFFVICSLQISTAQSKPAADLIISNAKVWRGDKSLPAEDAYLSVDGQIGMPVHEGDRVRCRKSEHKVHLLRVKKTFFDVLRTKLKWGQR